MGLPPRARSAYPEPVDRLIDRLSRLPGIGRVSAERLAFHVLTHSSDEAFALARAIQDVKTHVRHCSVCFNLTDADPCPICADPRRDASRVLVVEQPRDQIALEHTGAFDGVYHVLMGRLEPLDDIGPEALTIDRLLERVDQPEHNARGVAIEEVILGLNPNLEGDHTALYLQDQLALPARTRRVRITRLARGLPAGGQLEYANKAVLSDAILGRQQMG